VTAIQHVQPRQHTLHKQLNIDLCQLPLTYFLHPPSLVSPFHSDGTECEVCIDGKHYLTWIPRSGRHPCSFDHRSLEHLLSMFNSQIHKCVVLRSSAALPHACNVSYRFPIRLFKRADCVLLRVTFLRFCLDACRSRWVSKVTQPTYDRKARKGTLSLSHRHRVHWIALYMPSSELKKLFVAMDWQFSILECLNIVSSTPGVTPPPTFGAPNLFHGDLMRVALPIQYPLLTAAGLISLRLRDIPRSAPAGDSGLNSTTLFPAATFGILESPPT
jgi:hypothetical protein